MKKLFSYLFLSLLVMGVASCSDDALVSNESGEKNVTQTLSVTGTIVDDATTRVSLADNNTSLTPSWEVGDQVFGFYGDNKLTYRVASVAGGVATFSLVSGTEPADGTTVHMIYAPGKSVTDLDGSNQLAIDLSQQDGTLAGVKNHAIMCATATVSGTSLELSFQNQVAILGVKQFTGLKANTTYTSASFTSAGPTAIVKVEGGVLKLVTDDAYGTITTTGSFVADESGKTTSTIYFAVPPTDAVEHQFTLVCDDDYRIGAISAKAVAAGKYLYMSSKALRECVDLGLPSHTLWAATNVGASSPEGFGDYFAWGEVEIQASGRYWWDSYKWGNASSSNSGLTKYNSTDGLTRLLPEDDAATVNWKNSWRIPTKDEFDELINTTYTTLDWTTQNGVSGMKITSKVNGKSIFLPAAGLKDYGYENRDPGACNYPTSDLMTNEMSHCHNYKYNSNRQNSNYGRCGGRPVRAVFSPMALPTTPIPSSALVQHWTFDGNTNNSVTSINASMTRTAPTLTTDRFGNENSAYYFGGNGGMIAAGAFEFGTSSFTANVWVCTSTNFTSGHNILRTDDGARSSGCLLRFNRGNIEIWEGRSAGYQFVSPNTYNDGAWHMLTYVRDVENSKGQLYVDGVYVGGYTISSTINNVTGNLRFGNVDGMEYYTGKIDDVRLYDIALSPSQILGLYTPAPVTPPTPPTPPAGKAGTASVLESAGRPNNECGWVQLWENGPRFATMFVGSTEADYSNCTSYSQEYCGGMYGSNSDAATAVWGPDWAVATLEDYRQMYAGFNTSSEQDMQLSPTEPNEGTNCIWEWMDGSTKQYTSGCTIKGWKVSGKGAYAANSIFFPLSGCNGDSRVGEIGVYYTATGGYRLYFDAFVSSIDMRVYARDYYHMLAKLA